MTGPVLATIVMTPMYTADAWALMAGKHTSYTNRHRVKFQLSVSEEIEVVI